MTVIYDARDMDIAPAHGVIANGVESDYVIEALTHHEKLLSWMDSALEHAPLQINKNKQ